MCLNVWIKVGKGRDNLHAHILHTQTKAYTEGKKWIPVYNQPPFQTFSTFLFRVYKEIHTNGQKVENTTKVF
ncbi:hypothetical protein C8N40_101242 [Pontibacter mucosus]|uniref:Uncharacterized protein n=1 Tax=Pontibacter mucosus TaxID=1649266 RepID=A0A2T5YSW8_9BACT|nr:hypothetical protein C8N40_101242 [Pontibacter mucosus]